MNDNAQSPTELLDETAPEANAEAATENASGVAESAQTEPEKATQVEEEKRLSRFQRQQARFDAQIAEQQREIEYLRRLATGSAPPASAPEENQEPKLEDYEGRSISEYIAARDRFLENKLITAAEQRARDAFAQEQHRIEMEKRVTAARRELTDWDEVMAAAAEDPVIPAPETVEFIVESEYGPQIGYYLAKNPDEHDRLNRLSGVKRVAELARLEDRVKPQAAPAPAPKRVTAAPAKLSETRGNAAVTNMDPAAAARQGYAAWKAADTARRAAGKK